MCDLGEPRGKPEQERSDVEEESTGADLREGAGRVHPPEMTCSFLIQLVSAKKNCGLLVLM